jgi:hypothetical protein
METGFTMLMHSVLLGLVLYFIMRYALGQQPSIAENRSILIAAVALIYMILFGHGLPTKVNRFI